ncbi:MAG: TlpA disulfide reductase family protein, partial [bacterium]
MPILALAALLVNSFSLVVDEAAKAIGEETKKLRSMDDDARAKATLSLAQRIRKLPDGDEKLALALGLASRATEGDCGRETLQEVTNALVDGVDGVAPGPNSEAAVSVLAVLKKYEHMNVQFKKSGNTTALSTAASALEKTDDARARNQFALKDLDGKTWNLADLKGKVVMVNFWATWCPPCRKEMPDMQSLYDQFKDQGFVILSISDETEDKVKPFIEKAKYNFPILLDPDGAVHKSYFIQGIPKSFIY